MFHHDPQFTGDAGPARLGAGGGARSGRAVGGGARFGPAAVPCRLGGPNGYYEVDKGGHVFGFGNVAVVRLGRRRRARAGPAHGRHCRHRRTAGGYWLVDRAGQVFAFGDARSYGSLPRALGRRLACGGPDGHARRPGLLAR